VHQQNKGKHESDNSDPVHGLPQLLARFDVEKRHAKEDRGEKQHQQILHCSSSIHVDTSPVGLGEIAHTSELSLRLGVLRGTKGNLKKT
jgi:hypothetical protein